MKFFIMNFISTMMEENNCRQLKVENKLKLIQLQSIILYITKKKKKSEFEENLFHYFKKSESVSRMSHHSTTLSHSKRVNSNRCCTRTADRVHQIKRTRSTSKV